MLGVLRVSALVLENGSMYVARNGGAFYGLPCFSVPMAGAVLVMPVPAVREDLLALSWRFASCEFDGNLVA
jgi:hypothetical protein